MISRDEAIAMAKKAWNNSGEGWVHPRWFDDRGGALEAIVNLAYNKGLEDAAKACEAVAMKNDKWADPAGSSDAHECVDAIRKLKGKQ